MLKQLYFLYIFCGLVGSFAAAEVRQSFQVQTFQDGMQIQVEIQNGDAHPLKFDLSKDAVNLSAQGAQVSTSPDGNFSFTIDPSARATLFYRLSLDLSKPQFLTEEGHWYPTPSSAPSSQIFSLLSQNDPGIELVSSATGHPQDSLAVVVGPFTNYSSADHRIQILLQNPDPALAANLIDHLVRYLALYEQQIGPYPYDQFSVVESPDEIGYAFPKMTWIGSQLLRFPFILNTSLPHELLHSWWGNGVFVSYQTGNWCEGLTVVGADYGLLSAKEQKVYRVKAITSYLDYAHSGNEIPLSDFVSRGEDPALQAIGYGKTLMVLQMLQQRIGADKWALALKNFYSRFKYQEASWNNLITAIEDASGLKFDKVRQYWIQERGLVKSNFIRLSRSGDDSIVAKVEPNEWAKLAGLQVRLRYFFGDSSTEDKIIQIDGVGHEPMSSSIQPRKSPVAYAIDPEFEIFRELSEQERPLTFSQTFSAKELVLAVTPQDWALAIKSQFPDKTFHPTNGLPIDFNDPSKIIIMDLAKALQMPEVKAQLENLGIRDSAQGKFMLDGQVIDPDVHGMFFNVRVNRAVVTVIHLNPELPLSRWLARWIHYSSQSYTVLKPQGTLTQGLHLPEERLSL